MSPNLIVPAIAAPLIVWRLYARTRRNIGRQMIQPKRMWTRVAIFSVLSALIACQGFLDPRLAAGLGVGLVGGALLGLVALKLTRFEVDGANDCYYPNVWIGLGLTALFIGRLVYRMMVLYPDMAQASGGGFGNAPRSPLTLVILGLLFGYYIAYYAGVLIHHRRVLGTLKSAQP